MKRYLYLISLFFIIPSVNAQCNNYSQSIIGNELFVTPDDDQYSYTVGTITITGNTFNLTLNNSIAWVFTSGSSNSIKMGNALKINIPCQIPFLYLGYLKSSYGSSSTVSASIQDNYLYFNCDSGTTCTSLYGMNVTFSVNIPLTNWFPDADNDTHGSSSASPIVDWIKPPGNYVTNNLDCNDSDANLNPQTKWYQDTDNDNFGDANNVLSSCTKPIGPIEYIRNRPFDECPTVTNTTNFGCPLGANPTVQITSENYITITEPLIAVSDISNITDNRQKKQVTQYFDGLGRPKQTILIRATPSGKDIITHHEYDVVGRQSKEFLPYPGEQASGKFSSSALNDVQTYYNTTSYQNTLNPFSQKSVESSPLNRVLKQAAPGTDWALNSGHEIKLDYQTNTTADVVKLFTITANWDVSKGLYDIPTSLTPTDYVQFQLYKTIIKDENWVSGDNNTTEEFKNKEGQVVLKRTYDAGVKHDTYYVYDQYGNLTFVVPPLVDATVTISNAILGDLCYQYKYDYRNRLVEKKVPGKQWEFIVYDKLDRIVATGPAFSPFSDLTGEVLGWLITKYDVFNRPVYTGWEQSTTANSAGRTTKQTTQNNLTTTLHETKSTPGIIDGIASFYTNILAPTAFKLLSVNYYDDYVFTNAPIFPAYSYNGVSSFYNNSTMKPKGMPTGSWTRVITTSSYLQSETNYVLYDYKARPIRNYTANYLGGFTRTDTSLDFSGKTTTTYTTHKRSTNTTDASIIINEGFTYTPQGRLLNQTHQINNGVVQLLSKNEYDELGQLIVKSVGGTDITGISPLQKVDYTYNIRGWMTEINKVNALQQSSDPKDLFGFKINYNIIDGFSGATQALYNGNIAETFWSNNADGGLVRAYGYLYDNLNRLKDATYYKMGSLPYVSKAFDENLTYDKNGNILTLKRNGGSDVSAPPNLPLDDLLYTYAANSNKLLNVLDNSNNNTAGFVDTNKSGDDFTYDLNGNLIHVKNKIMGITYNHLNLPTKIFFGTTDCIEYIYDAIGKKVEKRVFTTSGGSIPVMSYYLNGFQYNYSNYSTKLQFVPTSEGYYDFIKGKYVFNYTDHLGNIRLSYAKNPTTNVLEILEESNYYPFGLKHSPSAVLNAQPTYKYKYNGKELQDEFGLNMYDYGARNYDPALGRWMNIDPLAEKYNSYSSYNYTLNNPVFFIDPDGRDVLPYLVRTTLPTSGLGKYERGLSTRGFASAMKDFMKTSYGGNFVSQFMKKDQSVYGYTSKSEGKYSMHDLNVINVNIKDPIKSGAFMTAEGSFDVSEKKGGGLAFTMYINDSGNKTGNGETIAHEGGLHGVDVDQIIEAYKKGGIEAVEKLRASDPQGKSDHEAIKNDDTSHPGVKVYNQIKEELIEMDKNYKKIFEAERKLYKYQY